MSQYEHGRASFNQRMSTEDKYLPRVIEYLWSKESTTAVEPATSEQQIKSDIDLIWSRVVNGREIETTIEVKCDTYAPKNFAFETISNEVKGTKGCFLRCEADLFFYYFVEQGVMYRMEMKTIYDWFVSEMSSKRNRFPMFETYTQLDNGMVYSTFGRLVPVQQVLDALVGKVFATDMDSFGSPPGVGL